MTKDRGKGGDSGFGKRGDSTSKVADVREVS